MGEMKVEWVDIVQLMSMLEHEAACDCCKDDRIPVVRLDVLRAWLLEQPADQTKLNLTRALSVGREHA